MARDRVKLTSILGSEVEVNSKSVDNYLAVGFKRVESDPAPRSAAKKAPAKPAAKKED